MKTHPTLVVTKNMHNKGNRGVWCNGHKMVKNPKMITCNAGMAKGK